MENKKNLKGFGFKDILAFLGRKKKRETEIDKSSEVPAPKEFSINAASKHRHPKEQLFVIDSIIDHGKGCKTYRLKSKDGAPIALFRPGQYVVVREMIDGKLVSRPISISSGIEDAVNGFMDLTIKENKEGFFSPHVISSWSIGTEVKTSGPQGNFYYTSLRDEAHVIAVAGGSGITPILSMAKSIHSNDEDFVLDIIYCCKSKEDAFFLDVFNEISKEDSRVRLHLCLESDEDAEFHGLLSKVMIEQVARKEKFSLFACGPQGMYKHLDRIADELGLDFKHYRKEIFGMPKDIFNHPSYPKGVSSEPVKATVHMCGKDYEIPLRKDETIITAFERAGIAGPNRCRGGICGYCRSKLIKGEVFIPEECDGRRAHDKDHDYIHPCAAYPLTDIEIEVPNA